MYLREHHFKTNSLQRKQSPLESACQTSEPKKCLICAMRAMAQTYVTVGVTFGASGGPSGISRD